MVAALAGMIPNAAVMGAKIERVGREKFMNQNGELTALIGNRVLVRASGGELSRCSISSRRLDLARWQTSAGLVSPEARMRAGSAFPIHR
ncbi:MAG: hypothetical protein R3D87_14915 [Paracoccaceae bacterium]